MNPPLNQLRNGIVHEFFKAQANPVVIRNFCNNELAKLQSNTFNPANLNLNAYDFNFVGAGTTQAVQNEIKVIRDNKGYSFIQAQAHYVDTCFNRLNTIQQHITILRSHPESDTKNYAILHLVSCFAETVDHVKETNPTLVNAQNGLDVYPGMRKFAFHGWDAYHEPSIGQKVFKIQQHTSENIEKILETIALYNPGTKTAIYTAPVNPLTTIEALNKMNDAAQAKLAEQEEKKEASAPTGLLAAQNINIPKEDITPASKPEKPKISDTSLCKPDSLKKPREDDDKDPDRDKNSFAQKRGKISFAIPKLSDLRGRKTNNSGNTGNKSKQASLVKEVLSKGKNKIKEIILKGRNKNNIVNTPDNSNNSGESR